jgi:hypothetical protein
MAQVAETMHKDSCMCSKSELDLFSVPPTQVVMENGFWEDADPITRGWRHSSWTFKPLDACIVLTS